MTAPRSSTTKRFANGWYLTGDLAMPDADGYFWFIGRPTMSSNRPAI